MRKLTIEEKDKIWIDNMVTRLDLNRLGFNFKPIPIDEFHMEIDNPIATSQKTGIDNYQSWNWRKEIIK
jgi:hypothetical protein